MADETPTGAVTGSVTGSVTPRGAYPHLRRAGGLVFLSGTSSRRPDNTFAGASVDELGTTSLDIAEQTRAVLENMERTLEGIGLDRADLVDVTSFLVNMNDFGPYNTEWGAFFDGIEAPARTTVAVHQLPHPHLLIEMKATAIVRPTDEEPT
jgi:2-aminomuconate deaminase